MQERAADNTRWNVRAPRMGFTLVEVLLVMLITSVLVLGISGAYRQARQLYSQVEGPRHQYHMYGNVIESLRADLAALYMPPVEEGKTSFALSAQPDGSIDLMFYSLSPLWRTGAAGARSAVVQYRFVQHQGAGESTLERLETPCAGESIIGEPVSETVAEGKFEFHVWVVDADSDGSEQSLRTSHESHERPPKALKVRLECAEAGHIFPVTFETLIEIPCESLVQGQDSSAQRGG